MEISGSKMERRMIPYPPSLSSVPASTIEPAIGASTWAFGNHRCRQYIGILTRNAKLHVAQNNPV